MELTDRFPGPGTPPAIRAAQPSYAIHPFAGNDFCLLPGTDVAVTLVGGCASGLLRRVAGEGAVLVPVRAMAAHEADHGRRHKIAVWRDPVERLVATHAALMRGAPNHYFWFLDLYGAPLERLVRFAEFELGKADPLTQEPHIRRQSSTWTHDDVDEVVDFGRLRARLRASGLPLSTRQRLASLRRSAGRRGEMTDELRERIGRLYATDWALRPPG